MAQKMPLPLGLSFTKYPKGKHSLIKRIHTRSPFFKNYCRMRFVIMLLILGALLDDPNLLIMFLDLASLLTCIYIIFSIGDQHN